MGVAGVFSGVVRIHSGGTRIPCPSIHTLLYVVIIAVRTEFHKKKCFVPGICIYQVHVLCVCVCVCVSFFQIWFIIFSKLFCRSIFGDAFFFVFFETKVLVVAQDLCRLVLFFFCSFPDTSTTGLWCFIDLVSMGEIKPPEGIEEGWKDPCPLPLRVLALVKWILLVLFQG